MATYPLWQVTDAHLSAATLCLSLVAAAAAGDQCYADLLFGCSGLLAMKAHLDPGNKVLVDWRDKLDHCTWIYVTCDDYKNVIRCRQLPVQSKAVQVALSPQRLVLAAAL
jgi:hypothetical protein